MIMIATTTDIHNVVRVQSRCISLTRKEEEEEEESHDDISSSRERDTLNPREYLWMDTPREESTNLRL
jgi:hypothetical protein